MSQNKRKKKTATTIKGTGRKTITKVVVDRTPQKRRQPRKRPPPKPRPPSTAETPEATGHGPYFLTGETSWDVGPWRGTLKGGYTSGKGPYKVRRNSLMSSLSYTGGVPTVRNSHKGEAFVVSHREYVGEITSGVFDLSGAATIFTLGSYRLNPSNSTLFPWLSSFAGAFQEWELNGCLIQLRTESSDIAPAVTLGMYGLAAEYNVLQPEPTSKLEVENMENAGTSKISCDLIMPIECERSQTSVSHLYVGPVGGAADGDLRLYDICKFYVFSSGIPKENVKIAELWVTYEVAFYKPTITPLLHSQDSYSWVAIFHECNQTLPMGSSYEIANNSTSLISWDGTKFHLPKFDGQTYLLYFTWYQLSTASVVTAYEVNSPDIETSGCNFVRMWGNFYHPNNNDLFVASQNPWPDYSVDPLTGPPVVGNTLTVMVQNKLVGPFESWDPTVTISSVSSFLPPAGDGASTNVEVVITLFNRNFFEDIEGVPTMTFPVSGPAKAGGTIDRTMLPSPKRRSVGHTPGTRSRYEDAGHK